MFSSHWPIPFSVGFLIAIIGCGAVHFPYSYYAIKMEPKCYESGYLLGKQGKDGWPDLPLTTCLPEEKGNKLKCLLMKDEDFYSAQGEYLKCMNALIKCQKGKPPEK